MKEPARWEQRSRLASSLPETPAVSVIMGVYNQKQYVALAIESILAQTFADFELIIVDDGSTDDTVSVIKQFEDLRIILDLQPHRGLVFSLNRAIVLSRGDLLARMDADDIADQKRLEKQCSFLNNHPEIDILGRAYRSGDNPVRSGFYKRYLGTHEAVAKTSIFCIPEALCFQVLDVSRDDEHYVPHNPGLVRGSSTWTILHGEEN